MAFYKRTKREKRDKTLNLRVPGSIKESLARLDKAWSFLDGLEEGSEPFDPDAEPNESAAAFRLIEESLPNAWKEIGGFEPKTPEQWEHFYKTSREAYLKELKNSGKK